MSELRHALLILRRLAYARILCEFTRLRTSTTPDYCIDILRAVHRLAEAEQICCDWLLSAGDAAFLARVRISRALELQILLGSATARLGDWCDRCPVEKMPASHLFEWVSYDLERVELAQLEDAMRPEEAALYAMTLDQDNSERR